LGNVWAVHTNNPDNSRVENAPNAVLDMVYIPPAGRNST
jgi:hypothetical protein